MRHSGLTISKLAVCWILIAPSVELVAVPGADQSRKATSPRQSPRRRPLLPTGDRVELEDLKFWLAYRLPSGAYIFRKDLPAAIRNRGIAFEASEDVLQELQRLGATPELIAV